MDEWTIKTPNPICRNFFNTDLLTDFAALCLTDFIGWRYIHSVVCIFDPACELLPPWPKELYLCTVALLPSLWPSPPPPKLNVQGTDIVCDCGGGGGEGGGMLKCAVYHILQEFYTLFPTRFRTYKIATPPQTEVTSTDDIKGFVSLKFLRLFMYLLFIDFQGPPPSNGLSNGFAPIKIIKSKSHIKTGTRVILCTRVLLQEYSVFCILYSVLYVVSFVWCSGPTPSKGAPPSPLPPPPSISLPLPFPFPSASEFTLSR